jgi:hypothetical protein
MISSQTGPAGITKASRFDADAWFTPGRFAALLAALIVVTFFRVVSGQETFFYRDFGAFGYPLAYYHREAFWRGELPLWNPLNNCGLPFLAQWNTLTLYPLSLFYLLFPLSWSLGVFNLGHLFLAGLGMYFLARQWTGNSLAASLAGLAFAFNGLTWQSLMWPNNIVALGWMPWVVWAVERAWREGGRRVIVAALAGAMQMLSGAPEIIFLTWAFAGVWWLAGLISTANSRASIFARFALALLLVTALAAAQLLPFLDLLAHSHRDTGFGDSAWSMPASGLANYLVPLFRCTANKQGVFGQVDQYWTASYYAGIGTVALALLAVWRARDKTVWLAAAVAAWSLLMALGDHGLIYPALKAVFPQLGFMRFPIKFVALATLLIPLLTAHALARLQALPSQDWPRERKRLAILALVFSGLILAIVWTAWKFPRPSEDLAATCWNAGTRVFFLVFILATLGLLPRAARPKTQLLARALLLALVWLDVGAHAPKINPMVERWVYEPGLARANFKWDSQIGPGESRAFETPEAQSTVMFRFVKKASDDFIGRRLSLIGDCNLLDDVPKVDGFYSLYLRESNAVLDQLARSANDPPGLLDFLGVSQISNPTNALDWVPRGSYLPMVTAGQKPVFADDRTALAALLAPDFNPRRVVYLPPEAAGLLTVSNASTVKVVSRQFSAQKIRLEIEADAPAIMAVAQSFSHCWRAYVDGRSTRIWRANYGFQALEIPAGHHEVKLVYADRSFFCGSALSLGALLFCGLAWFRWRKQPANNSGCA